MTERTSVKRRQPSPRLVGVIASRADLRSATRLRRPPDLFEVRLDALHPLTAPDEKFIARLTQPLIITARHPREGGHNQLSAKQRREILLRFLSRAAFVDIELSAAAEMRPVLAAATHRHVAQIISVHDLKRTPSLRNLNRLLRAAENLSPDIFKLVTRTERPADLECLLHFFDSYHHRLPMCVMGLGRLGLESRRSLGRRGSVLHYVHLGTETVPGQFSLAAARRLPVSSHLY